MDSSWQVAECATDVIIAIELTLRTCRSALTPHRRRLVIHGSLILVGQHLGGDALLPRRVSG